MQGVFGITGTSNEARREPVLVSDRGYKASRSDEGRQEPPISFVTPAKPAPGREQGAGAHGWTGPGFRQDDEKDVLRSPEALAREPEVNEKRWWVRLRGPIGSLALHLLPLLLLIDWQMSPPAEIEPVTVQLVVEPPPPEVKPAPPQPPPKPVPPPPRGRIASEDLGDPEAKEVKRPKGEAPAAVDTPVPTDTPPNDTKATEKPQQTAAMVPPPLPPAKPDPPKAEPAFKPLPKPSPPARQPPRHVEEPANMAPRRARFPGPAATRDEYLAYMHSLIRQHYNLLPMAIVGDRRGATVIEFLVLDDGTIAMVKVRRSSGYPDIDRRVEEMIAAVGRFPPLPQWFQGPGMPFEFGFPFPDALRE